MIYRVPSVWQTAFAWQWHGIGWAAVRERSGRELVKHGLFWSLAPVRGIVERLVAWWRDFRKTWETL